METKLSALVRFDEEALGALSTADRLAALYAVKAALMERIRLAEREASAVTEAEKTALRERDALEAAKDPVVLGSKEEAAGQGDGAIRATDGGDERG